MIYRTFALLLMLFTTIQIGCTKADQQSESDGDTQPASVGATPVNLTCPMMGGKVTEDGGSVAYNGKTVGFCCAECIEPWKELSEEEKQAKLAEAMKQKPNEDDDHASHHREDHG